MQAENSFPAVEFQSLIVLFVVIHAISTFLENLAFAIALHFLHLDVVQFTL